MGSDLNPPSSQPHTEPKISSQSVLLLGCFLYILAWCYPPLIILLFLLLSVFVPYAFRVNDSGEARRKFYRTFERCGDRNMWQEFDQDVKLSERYWVNDRGMCLFTSILSPQNRTEDDIKAVVCFCHGYSDNVSLLKRLEYARFVKEGIAVVAIEYEGHGRSDGNLCLLPSWERIIDDTSGFFKEIMSTRFKGKKCFLMGESMGGAIALKTYQRTPSLYSGVVFVAPMLQLKKEFQPSELFVKTFRRIAGIPGSPESCISVLPIALTGDVSQLSFRLPERRDIAQTAPSAFVRKPRLATAREMLDLMTSIPKNSKDFDAPFLMLHGLEDKVTDPKLSEEFYKESMSKDKQIKLYKGMWHTLTTGEPTENIDLVFADAISWLVERL